MGYRVGVMGQFLKKKIQNGHRRTDKRMNERTTERVTSSLLELLITAKKKSHSGHSLVPAAKVGKTTLEQVSGLVCHLYLVPTGQVQPVQLSPDRLCWFVLI